MKATLFSVLCGVLCACGDPGPAGGGPDGGGPDGGGGPGEWQFTIDVVDGERGGDGLSLAVDGAGLSHIVYFSRGQKMTCNKGGTDTPYYPSELLYATAQGGAVTRVGTVQADAEANGVSLAIDPRTGAPVAAYQAGPQGANFCGGSDAVLARLVGGSWQRTTLAAQSAAGAMNTPETSGDVVGPWSALAFASSGTLYVSWQDVHFAFANNDFSKADLEMAEFASAAAARTVSSAEGVANFGAGKFTRMAVSGDRVALAYTFNEQGVGGDTPGGVRVAVRTAPGKFSIANIVNGGTLPLDIAAAPRSGRLGVVFWDADLQLFQLRESDDGVTWSAPDLIDRAGVAGRYVSLRYDAEDRPVVAFYQCGSDPRRGCDPAADGVRLARRGADGAWRAQTLDTGGDGACGAFVDLDLGPDGKARLAYQCVVYNHDRGMFLPELRHAHEK